MIKRISLILITQAVTVLGLFLSGCDISKPASAEIPQLNPLQRPETVKTVHAVALKTEPFASHLELTGKALAAKESYLSLGVPGLIEKIFVERGERVEKGQLLLRLDRRGFELGVQQAEAAVEGARVATEQLATEIARVNQLLDEGAAPSATKDDLLAKDKGAKARTRMSEVALEQAQKALRDSVLRAPYNGVITAILKEKGEQAPAMPPTMLMQIMDTDTLEVQVFVPESAARFIKVGTDAEVIIESADAVTHGETIFVSDAIQPGARTFEARIRIDNKERKIKAGSFARVRLTQESVDDAMMIPVSAIARDGENNPYVFTFDKGKGAARKKQVELGGLKGARVRVLKGLAPGEQLITTEIASLSDGQAVLVEL